MKTTFNIFPFFIRLFSSMLINSLLISLKYSSYSGKPSDISLMSLMIACYGTYIYFNFKLLNNFKICSIYEEKTKFMSLSLVRYSFRKYFWLLFEIRKILYPALLLFISNEQLSVLAIAILNGICLIYAIFSKTFLTKFYNINISVLELNSTLLSITFLLLTKSPDISISPLEL